MRKQRKKGGTGLLRLSLNYKTKCDLFAFVLLLFGMCLFVHSLCLFVSLLVVSFVRSLVVFSFVRLFVVSFGRLFVIRKHRYTALVSSSACLFAL